MYVRTRRSQAREFLELAGEIAAAALTALQLAARCLRQRQRRDQHDVPRIDVVLVDDRRADGAHDRGCVDLLRFGPRHFLNDDKALLVLMLDAERGSERAVECGMRCRCGGLEILRVVIASADDDEILDAAGDEELAVAEETEIAGPQITAAECLCRGLGPIPVAGGDRRSLDADLAVDDQHFRVDHRRAAADKQPS